MLTFAESKHPVFRSTSPLSRGVLKSKAIISVNQPSIYGTVSDMCEECNTCHDRTKRPVVAGQSNPLFVPSVIKTNIPFDL